MAPRRFLPALYALCCMLLMAGCGSPSSSGTTGSNTPTPTAKHVASVPSSSLIQAGKLLICSDIPSPPQEFYNAKGQVVGSDIDTGNDIAARLGLHTEWVNSVFDTIILAVTTGKCDVVISGQNITPARVKQVEMIPYFSAGQTFVVRKGNPDGVTNNPMTLCGKKVAVQLGATEQVTAQQYSKQCTAAGKSSITLLISQKSSDALQQVQTGHAVAFFQDSPVAAYYVKQQPSVFQTAGGVIAPIDEGISVPYTNPKLIRAVKKALKSMEADGTYHRILVKWGEQGIKVPAIM